MSKRNTRIILEEMIQNIEAVLDFTKGMNKEQFLADLKTQYAVDRCFEIIGESARQIPDDFQLKHSEIEWHKMIAFRNILIHEYFRVERDIEWNIIQNTLPALKTSIENLLKNIP